MSLSFFIMEWYLFFIAFSVRFVESYLEISLHFLPIFRRISTSSTSSFRVQGPLFYINKKLIYIYVFILYIYLLMVGSRWLFHLSRHCLPILKIVFPDFSWSCLAILHHFIDLLFISLSLIFFLNVV